MQTSLLTLGSLFLRLGVTAFGGPVVHIAMMQDEVVRRRGWLTEAQFLDLQSAANLIPGPNSTELAIHIGWVQRRWAGLIVAGTAFIVPATIITALVGWFYVRFGELPALQWALYGVKPVVLAVVVQAIVQLAPKAAPSGWLRGLAVVALVLAAVGVDELPILFGAGIVASIVASFGASTVAAPKQRTPGTSVDTRALAPLLPLAAGAAAHSSVGLPALFGIFFKIGSVLFGSGYVLLAFLRADLVERLGWLTEAQLIDAVSVGQVTPGPVFTTATFIGFVLGGWPGAWVATAGIFLPAFIFVALSGPLVPRLRASKRAGAFLDGVNVASLALMVHVTFQLTRAALIDVPTVALATLSAWLLIRYKLNATWLIAIGLIVGWGLHAAGLA
ncbi:MAG: chromate efflux transporter [Polyangiales bacterium]